MTPSGKIEKVLASNLAEWGSVAWESIQKDIGGCCVERCHIIHSPDGTEDGIKWKNVDVDDLESESEPLPLFFASNEIKPFIFAFDYLLITLIIHEHILLKR